MEPSRDTRPPYNLPNNYQAFPRGMAMGMAIPIDQSQSYMPRPSRASTGIRDRQNRTVQQRECHNVQGIPTCPTQGHEEMFPVPQKQGKPFDVSMSVQPSQFDVHTPQFASANSDLRNTSYRDRQKRTIQQRKCHNGREIPTRPTQGHEKMFPVPPKQGKSFDVSMPVQPSQFDVHTPQFASADSRNTLYRDTDRQNRTVQQRKCHNVQEIPTRPRQGHEKMFPVPQKQGKSFDVSMPVQPSQFDVPTPQFASADSRNTLYGDTDKQNRTVQQCKCHNVQEISNCPTQGHEKMFPVSQKQGKSFDVSMPVQLSQFDVHTPQFASADSRNTLYRDNQNRTVQQHKRHNVQEIPTCPTQGHEKMFPVPQKQGKSFDVSLPVQPSQFDVHTPQFVSPPGAGSDFNLMNTFQVPGVSQMHYMQPRMQISSPYTDTKHTFGTFHSLPGIDPGRNMAIRGIPLNFSSPVLPYQHRHPAYLSPISINELTNFPQTQPTVQQGYHTFQHMIKHPQSDQTWVNNWLKEKKVNVKGSQEKETSTIDNFLKIHEAKKVICEISSYKKRLHKLKDTLIDNVKTTDTEWYREILRTSQVLRERLNNLQKKLFNKAQVDHLSELVKKRRKKRERQRKRRLIKRDVKVETLRRRIKLHREIDGWQHKAISEHKASQIMQSLKTEAGQSMVEVNKKQSDCKKLKNILFSLKELREIRRKTSLQRGVFIMEGQDKAFEKKTGELISIIVNRNNTYEDERKTLRVMMEEEKEEMKRLDDKRRIKRLEENPSDEDPLYPYRLYWLQAEESIIRLVHIRSLWDMYSVPATVLGASRIPDSWIDPSPPRNDLWGKYLQKGR